MTDVKENGQKKESFINIKFDVLCALVLVIFAVALAITDMYAGGNDTDELIASNEKASAYAWYQAKSVKQSIVEGQRELLGLLLDSGTVSSDREGAMNVIVADMENDIIRYQREKNEIIAGSKAVGEENWVQDIEDELGKVIGAKEYEIVEEQLNIAGDHFDLAIMFFEICLVLGAISLLFQTSGPRWMFFTSMSALGVIGIFLALKAINLSTIAGVM